MFKHIRWDVDVLGGGFKFMAEQFHEYAFDVKLFAVVRVTAKNQKDAHKAMQCCLDCMDLSDYTIQGINDKLARDVKITEASLSQDGIVFEVDGEEVEPD